MKPEQLKASILQSAMQGKLVEQMNSDQNVDVIFASIIEEKKDLEKKSLIKKSKKLPDISEEEIPYDVPSTWKWVRLNDVVYNHGQKTPDQIFSYIDIGSIDNVHQKLNEEETLIEPDKAPSRARKIVKANDIIYSTVRPYLHNTCIIDKTFMAEPIASTGFAVLACHTGLYNKYLFYYLLSPIFDTYANAKENSKGVAYPAINDDRLYRAVVPLPPIEEQLRIVAKIEELLPYVDRYAEAYEKLEQFNAKFPEDMKKSILQYAIQGKLVEQRPEEGTAEELYQQIQDEKQKLIKEGKIKKEKTLAEIVEDEIPFDIPESWKWVRWGNLSQNIQYGYNAPAQQQGRIRMVRISDIQNDKVVWETVPFCDIPEEDIETYLLKENDILFARTGGTVGKSFLVDMVPEEAIYAGYLIRSSYSKKICPQYIKYFMGTKLYWDQLRNGTIATAQPNCNGQTLSKMILPLPPLEEQYRIVAKLEELLPYCDQLIK